MTDGTGTAPALFDVDAEQAVLGSMMLSPDVITEVEGRIRAGSFYRPSHATIFRTVTGLAAASRPVDALTVTAALAESGELARIGGAPYLHELVAQVPVAANGPHYATRVAECALLRQLDLTLRQAQRLVADGQGTAVELLDRVQHLLAGVEPGVRADDGPRTWAQVAPTVLDAIEQAAVNTDGVSGVPTGLHDLDSLLTGLRPGQLVVVAARPGMGKSHLLAGFAQHATWRHKLPSMLFSLEMTAVELGMRLVSADSGVSLRAIQTGRLDDADWTRVTRATGESAEAPLWIDDTPGLTLADIRTRARRQARCGGLALVAVDYLQLVTTPRAESRQVAVGGLSRGLKLLAKELNVPVVVAAQLNRNPESRADKRPTAADLRESGAIESDADVVILIHREDHYDHDSPRAGEADLIVAKNRSGPEDTVVVASQLHLGRFASMAGG
jgi:replicative DNA helicase